MLYKVPAHSTTPLSLGPHGLKHSWCVLGIYMYKNLFVELVHVNSNNTWTKRALTVLIFNVSKTFMMHGYNAAVHCCLLKCPQVVQTKQYGLKSMKSEY